MPKALFHLKVQLLTNKRLMTIPELKIGIKNIIEKNCT